MKESNTLKNILAKRYFSANGSLLLPLALKWRLVCIIACSLFIALMLPCLGGGSASAASIMLTVPGRLTLTVAADGAFHESATAATVSVKSDAYSGYTLGVKSGESTSPALKNGSNTISSISSAMAGSAFPVNTWGWLPSKLGGQANSQYQPGPTSTLVTIEKTTSPNASTANSYTVKLGAKVNGAIPAGTYVNTFTFTATANPVPYTITYQGESAPGKQTGTGMEGTQITLANAPTRDNYEFKGWCTVSTSNETCPSPGKSYEAGSKYTLANSANNVTLWAMWKQKGYSITYNLNGGSGGPSPNPQIGTQISGSIYLDSAVPTKSDHCFKGWCSVDNTADPSNCAGTTYSAGAYYYLSSSNLTKTLYAVWEQPTTPTTMQNFTSCYCELRMTTHQTMTLPDIRDNNSYTVAKLKDGKCWMIDNLKLGSRLSTGSTKVLTISDSDVPSSGFTMTMTAEKAKYTGSDATRYDMDAAYIDPEYGGYYSWHTATAGTGTYAMSTSGQNATNSICPKGWRLPTGGWSGEFRALATAYGGTGSAGVQALQAKPVPGFKMGGLIYNDGVGFSGKGSYGLYWSSTASNANYAYYLDFYSSNVYPAANIHKYYGYSVRCVSRQ